MLTLHNGYEIVCPELCAGIVSDKTAWCLTHLNDSMEIKYILCNVIVTTWQQMLNVSDEFAGCISYSICSTFGNSRTKKLEKMQYKYCRVQ